MKTGITGSDYRLNWLIALALAGWLLYLLAPVLTPFIAAALLAYIGDPVMLVIIRDILIIGGAAFYNFLIKRVEGDPTRISKLNTALELLLVLAVLARAAYAWPDSVVIVVLGAAVFVTVIISGIDYVWSWSNKARTGE